MYDELFTRVKRLLTNCLHGKEVEHSYIIAEITALQLRNTSSTERVTLSITVRVGV